VKRLVGIYRPTEKNAMVQDHYAKLGFSRIEEDSSGSSRWVLTTDVEIEPAPMKVDRAGFEPFAAVAV
jgi:predicted enzyme involved in methoxymalonyl-ACP biosynthesis